MVLSLKLKAHGGLVELLLLLAGGLLWCSYQERRLSHTCAHLTQPGTKGENRLVFSSVVSAVEAQQWALEQEGWSVHDRMALLRRCLFLERQQGADGLGYLRRILWKIGPLAMLALMFRVLFDQPMQSTATLWSGLWFGLAGYTLRQLLPNHFTDLLDGRGQLWLQQLFAVPDAMGRRIVGKDESALVGPFRELQELSQLEWQTGENHYPIKLAWLEGWFMERHGQKRQRLRLLEAAEPVVDAFVVAPCFLLMSMEPLLDLL